MDVEIEPQGGVKTLYERNSATLRLSLGAEFAGTLDKVGKNRFCENAMDLGRTKPAS
jgi:hypothetical protein